MRLTMLLPVAVFAGLAGLLFVALYKPDRDTLPSMLIGEPVPAFDLEALPGRGLATNGRATDGAAADGLSAELLGQGQVTLVNFWASWCAPCRVEHPLLMELGRLDGVTLHGVNYKDNPAKALQFLTALGDPYRRIGVDDTGRTAIDWGVYGVPETYLVDGTGTVIYRHVGPLTEEAWRKTLLPLVEQARASTLP